MSSFNAGISNALSSTSTNASVTLGVAGTSNSGIVGNYTFSYRVFDSGATPGGAPPAGPTLSELEGVNYTRVTLTASGTLATITGLNTITNAYWIVYAIYDALGNMSNAVTTSTYNNSFFWTGPPRTLTVSTACIGEGTLVETTEGEMAIEKVTAGMKLVTRSGDVTEVIAVHGQSWSVMAGSGGPMMFRENAFGPSCPSSLLFVSGKHGLSVHGQWGLAEDFAEYSDSNAVFPQSFMYYNVVTAPHSLIMAAGVPVSTWSVADAAVAKMPIVSASAVSELITA
jgi:hypothetical protein